MTGTFDNWSKSERLDLVGDLFQKTVVLPESSEKIFYKVGALSLFCSAAQYEVPRPGAQMFCRGRHGHDGGFDIHEDNATSRARSHALICRLQHSERAMEQR